MLPRPAGGNRSRPALAAWNQGGDVIVEWITAAQEKEIASCRGETGGAEARGGDHTARPGHGGIAWANSPPARNPAARCHDHGLRPSLPSAPIRKKKR